MTFQEAREYENGLEIIMLKHDAAPLFMSKRGDSPPSSQTASSHATIIFPG